MLNYFPNSVYSVQSKVIVCVSSVLLKCDCLHQFTGVQSKVIVYVISVWCFRDCPFIMQERGGA